MSFDDEAAEVQAEPTAVALTGAAHLLKLVEETSERRRKTESAGQCLLEFTHEGVVESPHAAKPALTVRHGESAQILGDDRRKVTGGINDNDPLPGQRVAFGE